MPTVAEALEQILARVPLLGVESLPLDECLGLASAEDVVAPESVPPFTNSAMDGYALRAADLVGASAASPVRLRVLQALAAGEVAGMGVEPGTAMRIMTGAPIPEGADAVVPVEFTRSGEGWVELDQPVKTGANIRPLGEDLREGELVLAAGTTLRPAEIGVLASLGFQNLFVRPQVRVAVLTTGDELVDVGEQPGPGQIRDSNIHALCAQLRSFGAIPVPFERVSDKGDAVRRTLETALASADVLLTTGGISVGDYDPVKPALEALRAEKHFWKVAQKPGGPLGFWTLGGKPIFGIPGNPVAAMVMAEEYVRPALRQMMGHRLRFRPEVEGRFEGQWRKGTPDGKLHFLRVIARTEAGITRVALAGPQGSGQLSSMMRANALALVSEAKVSLEDGEPVRVHLTELPEDH